MHTDRTTRQTLHAILQLEDFAAWPVQEGPEFIHGLNAPLRVRSLWQHTIAFLGISIFCCFDGNMPAAMHFHHCRCYTGAQKLIQGMGISLREYSWPDRWWLGKVTSYSNVELQ
jgi:hypothetical protein